MAGQGNFRPNYNYTFSSYDSMNTASVGVPPVDNQPMFPIDYRQYHGNPVFPSSVPAPETNFGFDRTQSDYLGMNFSTHGFSDQPTVSADHSVLKRLVKTPDSDHMSESVLNFCVQDNASSAPINDSETSPISVVNKDSLDKSLENVIDIETHRLQNSNKNSVTGKSDDIKEEIANYNSKAEIVLEVCIKKEPENDAEELVATERSGHDTENNEEVVGYIENDKHVSPLKKETILDDEIVEGETDNDDDDDTSDVSDASTIIEDEDEINDKLKKRGKTPKVKFGQNKGSRKKPRKQTLPKPVKPVDKKEFTCETCAKVVQSQRALIKHRNLHTDKYKCEECNKIFNSEVSLKNHHKVHSGFIGSEICNVCDKTFYDRSSLNKHTLSVHMGIKNFQCEHCNLSFFARKTYEEHVRVHTGERPFKCTECPKSYKRISDLNHHLKLHKGEVSHTCEKCGEGFRRVSELNRHMTKHAGDDFAPVNKPTKRCSWCGLTFATTKALNKHFSGHMDTLGTSAVNVPTPVQFEQDKMKLVDEIVQDLGTNLIGPEISSIVNKGKFLPNAPDIAKDFNFPTEQRIKMNVFPYQGIDMTYRSMTAEEIPKTEFKMTALPAGLDNNSKVHKTDRKDVLDSERFSASNKDSNGLLITDPVQPKELVPEDMKRAGIEDNLVKEKATLGGVDYVGENDTFDKEKHTDNIVKSEIEVDIDYDDGENDYYGGDENDDYGGDTDVEDYEYVMNSSPIDKDSIQKKIDENISVKVEAEIDDEYTDDKDNKTTDSKDDEQKDPDFLPPGERIRKRKASVPRKKVLNKKQIKKESESDDETESSEGGHKKGKKRKSSKTESKPECEDASMDLKALKCLQCGKYFSKKVSLIKHMNLHRGTYSCEICGKCFSTKRSLEIHIDNHEGRKVNTALCNVCDKAFYDASSLNKHVKTVHMDYKPFPCTMCDRRFSENKTLVEHLRVHTGERPFACEVCGKTYKRASELNFHLRKHNGEVNLNCPECGKGFMRMGQLRQHMLLRHDKERPFRCFLCAKTFPTHPMLKDHQTSHANQRKHVCERCGYKFHTKSKLEKHLKRKTDCQAHIYKNMNGMFVCKFCYGEFSTVDERKAHIDEVHRDDASFPCEVCGKHFRRSQALKIHLKIHYQVRDYKCTMCSAAFIQRHHLTQHIATHTGSRQYQCQICLKNFAHNATLYNHMKHH